MAQVPEVTEYAWDEFIHHCNTIEREGCRRKLVTPVFICRFEVLAKTRDNVGRIKDGKRSVDDLEWMMTSTAPLHMGYELQFLHITRNRVEVVLSCRGALKVTSIVDVEANRHVIGQRRRS
jgi:hypothetical protein